MKDHKNANERIIIDFNQAMNNAKSKETFEDKMNHIDQFFIDFENLERSKENINTITENLNKSKTNLQKIEKDIKEDDDLKSKKEKAISDCRIKIKKIENDILKNKEVFNQKLIDISQLELQFFENQEIEYTYGAGIAYQRKKKGRDFLLLEDIEELRIAKKDVLNYIGLFEKIEDFNISVNTIDTNIEQFNKEKSEKEKAISDLNREINELQRKKIEIEGKKTEIDDQLKPKEKRLSEERDRVGKSYIETYKKIIHLIKEGSVK